MSRALSCVALLVLGLAAAQSRGDDADAPRLGKYLIHSYGATGKPPLYLGYFVLAEGGVYKVFLPGDKLSGEGRYEYAADKKSVTWKTGPYAEGWTGDFTVEREGKTHKIRLKRTTIGTNSTDSDKK